MLDNLQFVHAYTFNAPKIKCTSWLINPWMCQYELIGRITTNHDRITHYAVPNDTVVGLAGGNFPGAIMLAASDAGHSSRSFFEDKYTDVPGFSVGKRRGLSGEGYQDPVLAQMHFVDPTVVTVVDTFGTVLSTKKYFWTSQQEANTFDVGALVPEHHYLQGTATAPTLGKTTTYTVAPDSFTYTYRFFRAGDDPASAQALKRSDIRVSWGQAYELPTLPAHAVTNCTWTTGDALPRVSPTEITADREFTVFLTEVCAPVTTTITLVDADSGERVGTVERVTPEGATITLSNDDLPEGYTWSEGEPKQLQAGAENAVVKVKAIRPTVTYRYMVDGAKVGSSSETLAWGADSSGALTLPEGYALVDPSASWVRTHVTENLTVNVPVKRQVHQVVYRFIHQGATVGTQSQSVSHGDSAAAPVPPAGYRLDSDVVPPANVTGPQNIDVRVVPIEHTITYVFEVDGKTVGTPQTETVLDGRSATGAYTLPSGYVADLERGVVLPTDVHGDATVTVPVKKAQWTITYVFVDADSAAGSSTSDGETPGGETTQYTTVGEPVTEEVTHGEEARKVLTAPEGWELTQDLPAVGKVTESRTLTILVRRKPSTPKPGETPSPKPGETSSPKPAETSSPKPAETSSPKPAETPAPKPAETPSPKPVETSSPKPGETSSPKPAETPVPKPGETSTPEPAQTPSSSAEPSGEQAAPGHGSEATPGSTAAPTAQTTASAAGARGLLARTGVQVRAAALLAAAALIAGTVLVYRARRRR